MLGHNCFLATCKKNKISMAEYSVASQLVNAKCSLKAASHCSILKNF